MHRCSAWRVSDHVKLSNCVSLTIFTCNYHFPIFSLSYGTQSPINDDVKAVTDVLWPPKDLASTDLHPVQRGINLQYWKEVRGYPLVVKMHTEWRKQRNQPLCECQLNDRSLLQQPFQSFGRQKANVCIGLGLDVDIRRCTAKRSWYGFNREFNGTRYDIPRYPAMPPGFTVKRSLRVSRLPLSDLV